MLEMTLSDVDPEFIYLSEPISDNKAPLISPARFAELMVPAYRSIISVARAHGCSNILVSTYGNSAAAVAVHDRRRRQYAVDLEAAETPELDYRNLRQRYGRAWIDRRHTLEHSRSESPNRSGIVCGRLSYADASAV